MLIVEIKKGDNIEKALKTLKSKVIKTRLVSQLNERREYQKKSVKNRNKILKAIYSEKNKKNFK